MKPEDRIGKPFYGPDAPGWTAFHLIYTFLGTLLLAIFRTNVKGLEKAPEGPIIVSGNHVSYMDGALLWALQKRYKHPVHFLIKAEMFKNRFLKWLWASVGALPVARGTMNRQTIVECEKLVAAGESLGIFPEGRRVTDSEGGELGNALEGVAFLAIRSDIPVVPVGIVGTDRIMPKGKKFFRLPKVYVRMGDPLYPKDFEGKRRERMTLLTQAVMDNIAQLMDAGEVARNKGVAPEHKHSAPHPVKQKMGETHARKEPDAVTDEAPTSAPLEVEREGGTHAR